MCGVWQSAAGTAIRRSVQEIRDKVTAAGGKGGSIPASKMPLNFFFTKLSILAIFNF